MGDTLLVLLLHLLHELACNVILLNIPRYIVDTSSAPYLSSSGGHIAANTN